MEIYGKQDPLTFYLALLIVVKPKYWCKHCKTYVRDTKLEKANHEATPKRLMMNRDHTRSSWLKPGILYPIIAVTGRGQSHLEKLTDKGNTIVDFEVEMKPVIFGIKDALKKAGGQRGEICNNTVGGAKLYQYLS